MADDKKKIEQLFETIREVVDGDGTWLEKKERVLAEASDDQKTALSEFCGWFS